MSGTGVKTSSSGKLSNARRKRINRLKKMIIGAIIIVLLIPIILCVFLLIRMNRLEEKLTRLEEARTVSATQVRAEGEPVLGQPQSDREENSIAVITGIPDPDTQGQYEGTALNIPPAEGDESGDIADGESEEIADHASEDVQDPAQWDGIRRIYLTFDDGPSAYTDDILQILADYDVQATFFVLGKTDSHSIEMYQQIVDQGHALGMHSYSHNYHDLYASTQSFEEDLLKLQDYLYGITGQTCVLYRFPGGSSNTVSRVDIRDLIGILNENGITYFDWNVSCGDGGSRLLSVQELLNNTLTGIEEYRSAVILMHDSVDKRTTVEALPILIERLMALPDTILLPITEETTLVQHVTVQ